MPSYNEEDHILEAVSRVSRRLEGLGYKYEIIVVDDGSTDGTADAVRGMGNERVRVVGYDRNMGKGFALKYGLERANGDFVVFMDSDTDIGLRNLPFYLRALRDYDIIVASKRHPKSKYEAPIMRKFLSFGFQTLVRLLTGLNLSDTQSGLKAGRAEVLKKISPLLSVKRYAFDVEFLTVAKLLGCRFAEMPIDIKLNSRFSLREVLRMLIDLLGITYRLRVRGWYQKNIGKKGVRYRPLIKW